MRDINAITSPLVTALNRIRKTIRINIFPEYPLELPRSGNWDIEKLFCAIVINSIYSFPPVKESSRWSSGFVFRGLVTSISLFTTFAFRRHDPPETPNPSKSSEPTTPSRNAPRTSPPNKRAMPDHTRRLLSTGHERSIGWVSGHSLVMGCGSC